MLKYRGTYRVYMPIDNNGKPTSNDNDTYLKGKSKTEIFRYSESLLAIQFNSPTSAKNIIQKLNELNVDLKKFIQGEYESVYLFDENDIYKVNTILKFQTKGSKISPKSKRTIKKLRKIQK